jgi:nucleoid-associated protein YgaU
LAALAPGGRPIDAAQGGASNPVAAVPSGVEMPAAGEMTVQSGGETIAVAAAELTGGLALESLGSDVVPPAPPIGAAAATELQIAPAFSSISEAEMLGDDAVASAGEITVTSAAELDGGIEIKPLGSKVAVAAQPNDAAAAGPLTVRTDLSEEATAGFDATARDLSGGENVSIKAAEVEGGTVYVAGEAPPDTRILVYADDQLVGEVAASDEGAWLLEAQGDIRTGEVVLRADVVPEFSSAPGTQAEATFRRLPDSVVLEPAGAMVRGDTGPTTATGTAPVPMYLIIRRGDNLWRIAKRNYGRGIRYEAIFQANRDLIRDPDLIYPGQVFVIPTRDRSWTSALN